MLFFLQPASTSHENFAKQNGDSTYTDQCSSFLTSHRANYEFSWEFMVTPGLQSCALDNHPLVKMKHGAFHGHGGSPSHHPSIDEIFHVSFPYYWPLLTIVNHHPFDFRIFPNKNHPAISGVPGYPHMIMAGTGAAGHCRADPHPENAGDLDDLDAGKSVGQTSLRFEVVAPTQQCSKRIQVSRLISAIPTTSIDRWWPWPSMAPWLSASENPPL